MSQIAEKHFGANAKPSPVQNKLRAKRVLQYIGDFGNIATKKNAQRFSNIAPINLVSFVSPRSSIEQLASSTIRSADVRAALEAHGAEARAPRERLRGGVRERLAAGKAHLCLF